MKIVYWVDQILGDPWDSKVHVKCFDRLEDAIAYHKENKYVCVDEYDDRDLINPLEIFVEYTEI